jgi:hypothetical protein
MFDINNLTRRAILKCPTGCKSEFKTSKCSVTISVGQPVHEDDKFKAVLAAVNSSFKECTIMVCDSLQRYTLKMSSNLALEQLHATANLLGAQWLSRNLGAIKQLDINYNVIRWDDWLSSSDFSSARAQIGLLYKSSDDFRNVLTTTALTFLQRNLDKVILTKNRDVILSNSIEYLKEECAVMLLWAQSQYQFEVYPSPRNSALRFVHQHIISKINSNLVREVSVKYNKKKCL